MSLRVNHRPMNRPGQSENLPGVPLNRIVSSLTPTPDNSGQRHLQWLPKPEQDVETQFFRLQIEWKIQNRRIDGTTNQSGETRIAPTQM